MITEDYVSFEIAQLLKEKGFDWECHAFYVKSKECGIELFPAKDPYNYNNNVHPCTSAPTLQMAMKWLRKEKGIAIIPIISSILDNERFLWDVKVVVAKTNERYSQGWIYEEPERACEAALKYSLENLI